TTIAFPAKAGTHFSTAPSPDKWVPAFAGNASIILGWPPILGPRPSRPLAGRRPAVQITRLSLPARVGAEFGEEGVAHGGEIEPDQLALEIGQLRQGIGLRPDARHVDLDEFSAGDDRQQLLDRSDDLGEDRALVQGNAFLDTPRHQAGQPVGMAGEKAEK